MKKAAPATNTDQSHAIESSRRQAVAVPSSEVATEAQSSDATSPAAADVEQSPRHKLHRLSSSEKMQQFAEQRSAEQDARDHGASTEAQGVSQSLFREPPSRPQLDALFQKERRQVSSMRRCLNLL